MSDQGSDSGSPKGCVPLGTYRVEKTRGLLDGMKTRGLFDGMGTVGLAETNGHNRSIEDHYCDQRCVTPHGKLHGQIWESEETPQELTVPMERPTR